MPTAQPITEPDAGAPSMAERRRQSSPIAFAQMALASTERRLETERDQLALWVPVALGFGIAMWFTLANSAWQAAFICVALAVAIIALFVGQGKRIAAGIGWAALLSAIGCGLIWWRAERVAAPVLARPMVTMLVGEIRDVEPLAAREIVRLTLRTRGTEGIPPLVRINLPQDEFVPALATGAVVQLRARLMPPAPPALPGAYDFARRAWFQGLGATGSVLGKVTILRPAPDEGPWSQYRARLSAHVQTQMDGAAGAIGATLATGDRGALAEADAEAMRRSGLAHLLSISGLHVTAVVGAVFLLAIRLLALFPALALRVRLPLVAAGCAALAAVGYTLLTGAEVPTIRACVAAILVLAGLALGRQAITLRMIAVGAIFVLILWPEAMMGPSFQLSFAAVTAIVALHQYAPVTAMLARREEAGARRLLRFLGGLFLTGLTVELMLTPIALYHFHKAGLYGAFANIVAIPLTTFIIMPLEAIALLADIIGAGAPFWWLCAHALNALIALAHFTSTRPGAVTMLPTMAPAVFGLFIIGGLWIALWKSSWRILGLFPVAIATLFMARTEAPDLLITGEGKHVGIMTGPGKIAMLRTRTGDFAGDMLKESGGVVGDAAVIDDFPGARCTTDSCVFTLRSNERNWTIMATRSGYYIPANALAAACRLTDIVISDRRLPKSCSPRWLKVDRALLAQTGGMTIRLDGPSIETVQDRTGNQRWSRFGAPSEYAARGVRTSLSAASRPDAAPAPKPVPDSMPDSMPGSMIAAK